VRTGQLTFLARGCPSNPARGYRDRLRVSNMPVIDPLDATVTTEPTALARRLTLPLTVLFGLGVTIGAGIYVLVGATAARAGMHAPLAFVLAALVMTPTAASFAELAGRMPVSAGEATYVRIGLGSERLGLIVGLLVVTVGIVSAAAICQGSTGYIRALFPGVPWALVIPLVVLLTGMVAAWGILESMAIAGLMTLIEIGGLLVIIVVGARHSPDVVTRLPELWQGLTGIGALSAVLSTMLLAFFAFIGFEGLANIAEEVKEPERTLPRAIFITLALSTLLYVAVAWIALVAVPRVELAASRAPLSLVFERVTGASPVAINAISIVATINGIIAQMVMASRVLYGLAEQGLLPTRLARVHPVTRTPILATAIVMALVYLLAAAFPLEHLAEMTSRLTLVIFAFVNAALVQLKRSGRPAPANAFVVPIGVPAIGFCLCVILLLTELVRT
jgi:basic amino acid/polyamine antiporter, APA family